MKIAFFSAHDFEKKYYQDEAAQHPHQVDFFKESLTSQTAALCRGYDGVCCFVSDQLDRNVVKKLKEAGIKLIALRSAGYDHVDLAAAAECVIPVVRVPDYSPNAVAEHAVALLMALNRHIHTAHKRVQQHNFSLDGLTGFNLNGKMVGVIGTGRIGRIFAHIMRGFGCRVLAHDPVQDLTLLQEGIVEYVSLDFLYHHSDVISLHAPLLPETRHMVNAISISKMKPGVVLVNTARGGLINSKALLDALKSGQLGGAALDVVENEAGIFFHDLSRESLKDDVLAELIQLPNVLITSHQAFLTHEALLKMAKITVENMEDFEKGHALKNKVGGI